jgi:phenylacetate-coenzyme A ligase PaaK-like adenylate-forming protein
MKYEDLFDMDPFSLSRSEKEAFFDVHLNELTDTHYQKCAPYASILKALDQKPGKPTPFRELPFLPVRLFKDNDFYSVDEDQLIKKMTSSGTSGQGVSRIHLDKETSRDQTKALVKIMSSVLGKQRLPMIIVDTPNVLRDRNSFSARGAGILGFSMFGSKKMYALDDQMQLKVDEVLAFLEEHQGKPIFVFGFTFVIYKYFIKALLDKGISLDLSNSVLVHGGGWKKLVSEAVTNNMFRKLIKKATGIESVHDYYGMVEQTGSINLECECGFLHTSNFSEIVVRDPYDFSILPHGEEGIIQTISVLPKSYPGHSLLTEDLGTIHGVDDCKCGRKGTYFKISGRLKKAEIRGCSNVIS